MHQKSMRNKYCLNEIKKDCLKKGIDGDKHKIFFLFDHFRQSGVYFTWCGGFGQV